MFEKILNRLNERGFIASLALSKEDALKQCLDIIPIDSIPAFSGSETIKEINLVPKLLERGNKICHRSYLKDGETTEMIMKNSFSKDFIICSANALTLDGELVNTDGTANRIAATLYGPKNILMVVGKNKIVNDLSDAFNRIKNTAARLNCIRLNRETPCINGSDCTDCPNDKTICKATVIHHHPTTNKNFYVILVDENLGY